MCVARDERLIVKYADFNGNISTIKTEIMGSVCCKIKDGAQSPQIIHTHITGRVSIVSRASTVLKDSGKRIVTCSYNYKEASSGKEVRKGDDLEVYTVIDDEWLKVLNQSTKDILCIPKNYVAEKSANEIEEWFFGQTTKRQAERILMNEQERGLFLIRYSENGDKSKQNCYTLSMLDYDNEGNFHVIHFKITTHQNLFLVGSETYTNLSEIVQYFKQINKITRPCPKPQPHLWDLDVSHKKQWELCRDDLKLGAVIGQGNFGIVYQAYWKNGMKVAVKELKEESVRRGDLLDEAKIMKRFRHPGLLTLYGVCSDKEPIYLVLEYMSNGDLSTFLKEGQGRDLNLLDLIDIAVQISSAMEHLESKNLVHRDLAARNVLVGNHNIVKISDFGLTQLLDDEIYKEDSLNDDQTKIAYKWAAPEAIFKREFTPKSDVWSYGILLTELFTYGRTPYPGLRNQEVVELVKAGGRMNKPSELVPDRIYELMKRCWREDPQERISFQELTSILKGFLPYSD